MSECRYFPECQRCNEVGDSWIPCVGGSDGTRCSCYEPMPDVDAIAKLADELEREGLKGWASGPVNVGRYAARIRETLGVDDG